MTLNYLLNRISRSSILFLFMALPLLSNAQVDLKINELMPKNVSYSMDKSYITQTYKKLVNEVVVSADNFTSKWVKSNVWTNTKNYSMWVEVYNPTSSSKTLSNYYFTDELSKPTKWRPLSINGAVSGLGYSVLYFEREDESPYTSFKPENTDTLYLLNRQGHADFKLDPDGGKLYLVNASLVAIDSVVYPAQYRNISWGRQTDGAVNWQFFEQPSPGSSNNGKTYATQRCLNPVFNLKNGFYASGQALSFASPAIGETIYYTTNGSEPTKNSTAYAPGTTISLPVGVHKIRAKVFMSGKLSSDVVTSTYFIGQRSYNNLPVVSIVTDDSYFYSKDYGIYYNNDNPGIGLPGRGQSTAKNVNQDWDRPVNFEFFDKNGQPQLNQEVDVKILGGWSRHFSATQKSLAISPRDKFGVDRLNYDFFGSKPGHQYKDIQLRNSGNDNGQSMMLDGMILSISANRMDIDYLAYEPAVLFINGTYIGIENIRERSNADFLFSNYGYASDDVEIIEGVGPLLETKNDMKTDPAFNRLIQFLKNNNVSNPEIYRQVCDSIDVDEFINYLIPQIYSANTDWPDNNVKMWRKKKGGKWRWILYDTDFGFKSTNINFNAVSFAFGENGASASAGGALPEWSYIVLKRLCTNKDFVNKLVERFAIHMATTYAPTRVGQIIDSLANRIDEEFPSVNNFRGSWKNFAAYRNNIVMEHIGNRFVKDPQTGLTSTLETINIDANVDGAGYTMNNELIPEKKVVMKYFRGRTISLTANKTKGYAFDHWTYNADGFLLPAGSEWRYYYYTNMPLKNGVPSTEWRNVDFDDSTWNVGLGAIGHGTSGVTTTIPYRDTIVGYSGKDTILKFKTAYFRKKISITDLADKQNLKMWISLEGAALVYINGVEVLRVNAQAGTINYNTPIITQYNGSLAIDLPKSYLREGENLIAVEVHKYSQAERRLRFDMELTHQISATSNDSLLTFNVNGSEIIQANYIPYTEPEPVIERNIVINEVVSDNREVMDEYGQLEDYIELYNKGTEPIDIGGWYITDAPTNKLFYQIPTNNASVTTIQPGGHLILWADDDVSQGTQHLDALKLSKDGETLILSRKLEDNTVAIMDSVSFPVLGNLSYSRVPDGSATWAIQGLTFNAANSPNDILSPETSLIALYPTQVTESFTVRHAEGLMLSVVDLTGKVFKRERCTSNETVIQTGDLKRGMYLVMVGEKTFKVIRR